MATLYFTPDAEAAYQRLDGDPTNKVLLDRIDEIFDLLESDPGDIRVRQRRFDHINAWGVSIADRRDNWLIIWEQSSSHSGEVNVIYIGLDPLPR